MVSSTSEPSTVHPLTYIKVYHRITWYVEAKSREIYHFLFRQDRHQEQTFGPLDRLRADFWRTPPAKNGNL